MPINQRLLDSINNYNLFFLQRDNWGDLFEEVTLALYANVLSNGDVAIDGGANQGIHTRAIARACGPQGRVFAVEAAPRMMAQVKTKTQSFTNVSYVERALWYKSDVKRDFFFYPEEHGLSSLRPQANTSVVEQVEVTTTRLDDITDQPVTLIKLDIEGAEFHAMRGAERIMREDRPVIVFENGRQTACDRFDYSMRDFFDLFNSRGYVVYSVAGMPLIPENWNEVMPWQFVALHPASPHAARALSVTSSYLTRALANNYMVTGGQW